ncbi:hypothetical protein OG948_32780 [Embleya sp. NBC_00888]|uniref:hypothetical protein n=1 Tax=Embleya sp. NBC_00888 TaxID=2975960 RepID=UPI003864E4F1|nr:hypothetical protein OG948_32780 [Embleya sp. NBC_00888]
MPDNSAVPAWPVVTIELLIDDTVRVDGVSIPVPSGVHPRAAALEAAAVTARVLGRPVRAEAVEPDGTVFPLIVAQDGGVTAADDPITPNTKRRSLLGRRKSTPRPVFEPGRDTGDPADTRSGDGSKRGRRTLPTGAATPTPPVAPQPEARPEAPFEASPAGPEGMYAPPAPEAPREPDRDRPRASGRASQAEDDYVEAPFAPRSEPGRTPTYEPPAASAPEPSVESAYSATPMTQAPTPAPAPVPEPTSVTGSAAPAASVAPVEAAPAPPVVEAVDPPPAAVPAVERSTPAPEPAAAEPAPARTLFAPRVTVVPPVAPVDPVEPTPSWHAPQRQVAQVPIDEEPAAFPAAPVPADPPIPAPTSARAEAPTPKQASARTPAAVRAEPTKEQALKVAEIARFIRAGDEERALALAASLDAATSAGGDEGAMPAAREVHAYVAVLTGRPELALELYADAALAQGTHPKEAARMTSNAHYCWLRIDDMESAYDLGRVLLRAYSAVPTDPGQAAVRDRMRSLRAGLSG